jgi:DNA-binding HxlR family transcriptional regulator
MKINQHKSAIDHFNGAVQSFKASQQDRILRVMRKGRTYTGQQLAHLTGYTPNVISARLFELREERRIKRLTQRKVCPYSRIAVTAHKKATTKGRK